jgi:23S rRNA pseudouridine2604 synthase
MTEPVRLAKRLAQQMNCSRREAEQYIEGGWVRVDGQLVEEPMVRVAEAQQVEVDPDASLLSLSSVTLLLHKPVGLSAEPASAPGRLSPAQALLTAANQAPNDRSGIRCLKKHFTQLTLCTPIDPRASGLVVWTQDWRIARKLSEDAGVIEHELTVEVQGVVSPEALHKLCRPVTERGQLLPAAKVSVGSQSEDDSRTALRFALKGERPGQVDHLCEIAGLVIQSVKRIRIGRVPMQQLAPGQWRYLAEHERF